MTEPAPQPHNPGAAAKRPFLGPGRVLLIFFVGLIVMTGSFYAIAFTLPDDTLPGYGKNGKPATEAPLAPADAQDQAPRHESNGPTGSDRGAP